MLNARGFSLAKVLVMVAVSLAFLVAITSIAFQQTREVNALMFKAVMENVSRDVETVLSQSANCLNAVQALRLDDARAAAADANYFLDINQIVDGGATPRSVLSVGQPPAELANRVEVAGLRFERITRTAPNRYEASLVVVIEYMMQTLRIPSVRLAISTDPASPAPNKVPTACALASGAPAGSLGNCRVERSLGAVGERVRAACLGGERLFSGGGNCMTSTGIELVWDMPKADFNYLTSNHREEAAGIEGWVAECRNDANTARTEAYAICCMP